MMPDWISVGMGMSSRVVPGSEIYHDPAPLPSAPNHDPDETYSKNSSDKRSQNQELSGISRRR